MSFSFSRLRGAGWALGLIILVSIALFTWFQVYISGRFIAKDYVVPVLALGFAWGALGLLARKHWFWLTRLWALLVALLVASSCVLFEYYFRFGIHLSLYDIGALMQTNLHEATGYVQEFMLSPFSVASFVVVLVMVLAGAELMVYQVKHAGDKELASDKSASDQQAPASDKTASAWQGQGHLFARLSGRGRRYASSVGLALCLVGTVICCLEMTAVKYSLRFMDEVNRSLSYIASVKPIESIVVPAHKEQQGELYVLVIGESQNRDYMGLYNGAFATTPQLEAALRPENSVLFTQAYACFPHTVQALAYALSNQLISQVKSANIADIVNQDFIPLSAVLKGAQVHSFWLSNQNAQGIYDIDTTMLARTFDGAKFMTQSEFEHAKFDGVLLPEFQQVLQELDPKCNNVIIVHMMGTHGLYHDRYPKEYAKFQPELLTTGQVGALAREHAPELSFYLNATYYNDYVLSELIAAARAHPSFMGLLFFSDHADQLPYGHNFATMRHGMTHIPMFFTFSPQYEQRYGAKVAQLRARSSEFFINDRIYDLFLDLADIKSASYRPELSLASTEFKPLNAADAVLPEGKSIWQDPSLQVWRQWPHLGANLAILRCNSDQKMAQVASLGVDQVEVDLAYADASGLCLNHDQCEVGDLTLAAFLAQHRLSLTRLWLDLKESAADNGERLLAELEALDAQYDLKSLVVVESSDPKLLKILSVAGWQVSLRLSDELWEESAAGDAKVVGRELQSLINDYDLTALSCDSIHFAAIQSILQERNLLPALKLYVRAPEVDLSRSDIAAQIAPYQQAAMVLVPFESYFDY